MDVTKLFEFIGLGAMDVSHRRQACDPENCRAQSNPKEVTKLRTRRLSGRVGGFYRPSIRSIGPGYPKAV